MPFYEYKCEQGHITEMYCDLNKQPKKTKCKTCGKKAIRIFSTGAAYIKGTYVGDLWDKENIRTVSDKDIEAKKQNRERIRKMRDSNNG